MEKKKNIYLIIYLAFITLAIALFVYPETESKYIINPTYDLALVYKARLAQLYYGVSTEGIQLQSVFSNENTIFLRYEFNFLGLPENAPKALYETYTFKLPTGCTISGTGIVDNSITFSSESLTGAKYFDITCPVKENEAININIPVIRQINTINGLERPYTFYKINYSQSSYEQYLKTIKKISDPVTYNTFDEFIEWLRAYKTGTYYQNAAFTFIPYITEENIEELPCIDVVTGDSGTTYTVLETFDNYARTYTSGSSMYFSKTDIDTIDREFDYYLKNLVGYSTSDYAAVIAYLKKTTKKDEVKDALQVIIDGTVIAGFDYNKNSNILNLRSNLVALAKLEVNNDSFRIANSTKGQMEQGITAALESIDNVSSTLKTKLLGQSVFYTNKTNDGNVAIKFSKYAIAKDTLNDINTFIIIHVYADDTDVLEGYTSYKFTSIKRFDGITKISVIENVPDQLVFQIEYTDLNDATKTLDELDSSFGFTSGTVDDTVSNILVYTVNK